MASNEPGAGSGTATESESSAGTSKVKLARNMSGALLFFYVLGDVLGSGIYALIGLVARGALVPERPQVVRGGIGLAHGAVHRLADADRAWIDR